MSGTPWVSRLTRHVSGLLPQASRWHLRRLLFALTRPSWVLSTGLRVRAESIWDWTAYEEIFLRGAYDLAIDKALAGLPLGEPLRLLDLGSNLGFCTMRVVDRLRAAGDANGLDAILVDADARVLAEARRRLLADNDLGAAVKLVHGLVGQRHGSDRLSRETNHLFASLRRPGAERGEEVEYVDLDVLTRAMPRIDLLKCDIEGAELAFLEQYPGLLSRTRVVTFELHHNLVDTQACKRLLEAQGFAGVVETSVEPESSIYSAWR